MEKGACVPLRVHTIVISVQHSEQISIEQLRTDLMEHVIKAVVPHQYLDDKTVYHLQPSGKFVIGGPQVRHISSNTCHIVCSAFIVSLSFVIISVKVRRQSGLNTAISLC